ncbi:MAG: four helix bundle protein [Melioribacteraceae bacterium]
MDSKSKSFKDLIVWQKAHQFVLSIYRITKLFPKEELYGLSNQFRRAAVSIAANIAEGFRICRYFTFIIIARRSE